MTSISTKTQRLDAARAAVDAAKARTDRAVTALGTASEVVKRLVDATRERGERVTLFEASEEIEAGRQAVRVAQEERDAAMDAEAAAERALDDAQADLYGSESLAHD